MTSTIPTADPDTIAVGELVDLAASGARDADEDGDLPAGAAEAIAAAGFARHYVPARFGGHEGTVAEMTRAVAEVGEACTSTAWCAAMFGYAARFATHLPERAQAEAWADGPDALWVSGLVPAGAASAVDGGYRVEGRWTWVSGAEHADWAILAGPVPGPDAPAPMFMAVPRSDFRVERTWDAVGMRATGSHALVVDGAVVPEHRTVPLPSVLGGRNDVSDVAQHNLPLPAVGGVTCAPAALGAARAALTAAAAIVRGKPGAAGTGAGTASADMAIARAAVRVDTAQMLVERAADVLDAGEGRSSLGVRNARDCAHAADLLTEAVGDLMSSAGTSAQHRGSALQRAWRDVTVAASHAALRFEKPAAAWTAGLIGRD
ncbi:acyl-CoA dehydrogenase family protein [Pseudonocardia endophytica]|uniref:Two-component flavin-dependent monooxygenase n=1 Tax=Pseudonocardia endophytica TaxID=401976 RepID=A0A4R1HXE4_PSEEN|nr:acyl-CoA dehydrogenase family protein [Pseudonocardia endophytica]TCK22212.1 two-component flavin-dependent monooxygenase [Pseudonocardia endophytica]